MLAPAHASALPVGSAGKRGWLSLELGPSAGRTHLLRVEQRVPLHVGRALYHQADWPELAYVTITMPTGGFVEGDRVSLDVLARAGSTAHLTSQSATRAYCCPSGEIVQEMRLTAEGDAYLEWWPDPLIPYAGTRFRQQLELCFDPTATLLVADTFLAGRVARDELHAYDRLHFDAIARRPDGDVLFRDTLRLAPTRQRVEAIGLLGGALAVGSFYLLGPDVAARLEGPLAKTLAEQADGQAAVTRLPRDAGLLARALMPSSDALRRVQEHILTLSRQELRARGAAVSTRP